MCAQEKGKKKKKTASRWTAKKIGIIILCVGFAVIMVVSSLGTGWLLTLNPITSGDNVVVGVTFFDGMDRPVLTTSSRTFNATSEEGGIVWMCGQFAMRANGTSQKELISIPCFNYYYGEAKYALLSPEWNTIARNLEGMKQGESKRVQMPSLYGLEENMTPDKFARIGGNFSTVMENDQIILFIPENPNVTMNENTTPNLLIRTGYIKDKTADSVLVNYAYPVAEISVVQAN